MTRYIPLNHVFFEEDGLVHLTVTPERRLGTFLLRCSYGLKWVMGTPTRDPPTCLGCLARGFYAEID